MSTCGNSSRTTAIDAGQRIPHDAHPRLVAHASGGAQAIHYFALSLHMLVYRAAAVFVLNIGRTVSGGLSWYRERV